MKRFVHLGVSVCPWWTQVACIIAEHSMVSMDLYPAISTLTTNPKRGLGLFSFFSCISNMSRFPLTTLFTGFFPGIKWAFSGVIMVYS